MTGMLLQQRTRHVVSFFSRTFTLRKPWFNATDETLDKIQLLQVYFHRLISETMSVHVPVQGKVSPSPCPACLTCTLDET